MTLLLNSAPIALWHDIVHDAEAKCAITLHEELESYLVCLLVRYADKPDVVKQIIATEFLKGAQLLRHEREAILQEVGDKCLLFSGLFPHLAVKRMVKIGYFVNLGKTAYDGISRERNDLFYRLAKQFVGLMDVLQSVRQYSKEYTDLLPLEAYDMWKETGSRRALEVLRGYSKGFQF